MRTRIWLLATAASLTLSACSGCSDKDDNGVSTNPADEGKDLSAFCADNLPAEQIRVADSLVQEANALAMRDFEDMVETIDDTEDMERAKAFSPKSAYDLYEQALTAAPGHCAALFGKTVTSAARIVEDDELNAFIRKVNDADGEISGATQLAKQAEPGETISAKTVMRTNSDDLPQLLMETQSQAAQVDELTLEDIQTVAGDVILPKLNEAISRLDAIMDASEFEFDITHEGKTVQLDKGEVGPILAGLKVLKAYIISFCGTNLDARLNGNYNWIDTLDMMEDSDFDNLSPGQTAALDHVTGIFKNQTDFGDMKGEWADAYAGIPDLMISAIEDLQQGFQYGLTESQNGGTQENDAYVVGTGVDADIDPVDLERAVNDLNRLKKYFQGEVNITYLKGTKSLKVNIRKAFEVTDRMAMLPYFKVLPYSEWNDTISADTGYYIYDPTSTYSRVYGQEAVELKKSAKSHYYGLDVYKGSLGDFDPYSSYYSLDVTAPSFTTDDFLIITSSWIDGPKMVVAKMTPAANNTYTVTRYANCREVDWEASCTSLATPEQFSAAPFAGCVAAPSLYSEDDLSCPYVYNYETKVPFVLTDAAGKQTMTWDEVEDVENPIDLKGKVIFPDPTFGGVFPELTNDNIWNYVQSIEDVEPMEVHQCTTQPYTYGTYTYYEETCDYVYPGASASDLDILLYYEFLL